MIRDFKDLDVWRKSIELTEKIYCLTADFPKEELYGLTSQMRRSAVSIPSNIAEGSSRAGSKELLQFLSIARGSAAELETQIIIAGRLGYIEDASESLATLATTQKMLNALIRSLRGNS